MGQRKRITTLLSFAVLSATLVSGLGAQTAVIALSSSSTTVVKTNLTALTGTVGFAVSTGVTGTGVIVVTYSVTITNPGTAGAGFSDQGITVTGTGGLAGVTLASVAGDRVSINVPAGGMAGDGITLEGVRVDATLIETGSVEVTIGASAGSGFTFPAGSTSAFVVQSLGEGLVIDPDSETFVTFEGLVPANLIGNLIIAEGIRTAFTDAIGVFGQTQATRVQVRVGDLPPGSSLTFPAMVTEASTGATLEALDVLVVDGETTLPTSQGENSITYVFASTGLSATRIESFNIQYILSFTTAPSQVFFQTRLFPGKAPDIPRYLTVFLPAEEDLPFPEFEDFIPLAFGADLFTGLAFSNPFDFEVRIEFEAFDSDGALITGEGITNPAILVLQAGEQSSLLVEDLFGAAFPTAELGTLLARSRRERAAALFLVGDQGSKFLDGANAKDSILRNFIFPNIARVGDSPFTRIHVFNPAEDLEVDLELTLRDRLGEVIATKMINLLPRATLSEELTVLMEVELEAFQGGYLQGLASGDLIAWESFGNAEALNVLDAQSAVLSKAVYQIPHFVLGPGFETELNLVSSDTQTAMLTLTLLDELGVPVVAATNPVEVVMEPGGQQILAGSTLFGLAPDEVIAGSVRIDVERVFTGPFLFFPRLNGSVRFFSSDNELSTVLPLFLKAQGSSLYPHVAQDLGLFTGVVVFNPQQTQTTPLLEIFDTAGMLVGQDEFDLPPGGKLARLLDQFVEASEGQLGGYFRISAEAEADPVAHSEQEDASRAGFVDQTADCNSVGDADINCFPGTSAANDAFYLGFAETFSKVILDRLGGRQGAGGAIAYEYSQGSASWGTLTGVTDDTASAGVFGNAALADGDSLTFTVPSDWATDSVDGGAQLYWIRIRVTTGYTTEPIMSQIFISGVGAGASVISFALFGDFAGEFLSVIPSQ